MHGRISQHLARQCQIDRAARLAHGDIERAVDDGINRLAFAQLVVPLDEFAHHAALVERLLAPMDRAVARRHVAGLGDWRAPGGQQHRHVVARGIHQAADGVGGADGDMHHDGGRLAGGAVIAVRHRHRDVLVRHRDETREFLVADVAGERFHDRREVGAGIGEHVFDAAFAEPGKVGIGDHFLRGVVHGFFHSFLIVTFRGRAADTTVHPDPVNEGRRPAGGREQAYGAMRLRPLSDL